MDFTRHRDVKCRQHAILAIGNLCTNPLHIQRLLEVKCTDALVAFSFPPTTEDSVNAQFQAIAGLHGVSKQMALEPLIICAHENNQFACVEIQREAAATLSNLAANPSSHSTEPSSSAEKAQNANIRETHSTSFRSRISAPHGPWQTPTLLSPNPHTPSLSSSVNAASRSQTQPLSCNPRYSATSAPSSPWALCTPCIPTIQLIFLLVLREFCGVFTLLLFNHEVVQPDRRQVAGVGFDPGVVGRASDRPAVPAACCSPWSVSAAGASRRGRHCRRPRGSRPWSLSSSWPQPQSTR